LLLGKEPTLPVAEDRQRPTRTPPRPAAIMITGTGDHDPPDSVITISWNP